jgi:Tfp pilus assembly protein PilE
MACVAVLGILARIALPSFAGDSRKTKARAETMAMMDELASKEARYKIDKGSYLSAAACPTAPASSGQVASACTAAGQTWNTLGVALPESKLYCSYAITTGTSAQTPSPPSPFTMPKQASSWYYIVATCDMDGKPGNSTYFMSSFNSKIQASAEGA